MLLPTAGTVHTDINITVTITQRVFQDVNEKIGKY